MMMIIIILTASYINTGDDVHIVYALAIYDAIFFGNGRMDKAILGVRWTGIVDTLFSWFLSGIK